MITRSGASTPWNSRFRRCAWSGASDKPVSPEQIELARWRAENARLRMDRDILGKAMGYFAKLPQ